MPLPMKSRFMSYPATSFTALLPKRAGSPSGERRFDGEQGVAHRRSVVPPAHDIGDGRPGLPNAQRSPRGQRAMDVARAVSRHPL